MNSDHGILKPSNATLVNESNKESEQVKFELPATKEGSEPPEQIPNDDTQKQNSLSENMDSLTKEKYQKFLEQLQVDRLREDELALAYAPWPSDANKPIAPIPVRMIQPGIVDPLVSFVSVDQIEGINNKCLLTPAMTKEADFIADMRKKNRSQGHCRHIYLCWSIIIALLLLLLELIYFIFALLLDGMCGYVNMYLIVSAVSHCLIIILEWLRMWIRNVHSHPHQRGFVDFFMVSTAGVLVLIYLFCVIWFAIGFAWVMVPYTRSLSQIFPNVTHPKIDVYYRGVHSRVKPLDCTSKMVHALMAYQLYIVLIFILRFVMLAFGGMCHGIFSNLTTQSKTHGLMTPYVASTRMSEALPSLTTYKLQKSYALVRPGLLHSDFSCMIYNHPQWKLDDSNVY